QSGKSATMLPSMAASSRGHWNQDGSRRWQRSIAPPGARRTQARMSPRKPSTRAMPSTSLSGGWMVSALTGPAGSLARSCSIRACLGEVDGDAARHHAVHHQAVAEAGIRHAQDVLAQDAAVGMDEREGGVVADGADVAEMVGEALQLRHQRAQEDRARRRLDT